MEKEKKEIGKLRKLYRAYLTDDIKRDMYVNGADEKIIDLVEAEEVEEEDLYKFLNQLSVLKKFIKWLVENDKIDTQNLITYMNGTSLNFNKVPSTDCSSIDKTWNKFYTEVLLMLLSISDTPIEDLISYLK